MADAFTFDMRHGLDDLKKSLTRVERRVFPKAINAGLNKTVGSVRSTAVKAMAKETALKQKDVRGNIKMRRAGKHRQGRAMLEARGRPLNLIRFMTQSQIRSWMNSRRRPLRAKPWGKKRVYRRHVFIGNLGRTVFLRQGPGRRDIRGMWGPSIARELIRKAVLAAIDKRFDERWPIEIDRALNNELRKAGFRT